MDLYLGSNQIAAVAVNNKTYTVFGVGPDMMPTDRDYFYIKNLSSNFGRLRLTGPDVSHNTPFTVPPTA